MKFHPSFLHLYFIAGSQDCRHLPDSPERNLLTLLETALQNGITCFQYREKGAGALTCPERIGALAQSCRDLCRRYGIPFVVNDDVRLARQVGADGLHIGQDDGSIATARQQLGYGRFIGLSAHGLPQLSGCLDSGADYFGIGPIFATSSKADAKTPLGSSVFAAIRAAGIRVPLVAIGGIGIEHAAALRRAGADGVAVISAITQAADPAAAVKALL